MIVKPNNKQQVKLTDDTTIQPKITFIFSYLALLSTLVYAVPPINKYS